MQETHGIFKRIDHIELVINQPERTILFYSEILGFKAKGQKQVKRADIGAQSHLAYLELGDTTIELYQ